MDEPGGDQSAGAPATRRRRGSSNQPPPAVPLSVVTPDSDPKLIRDAHLFLLGEFGRSIGFGFHAHPLLEPPSTERITVFGRFDPHAPQREFGLRLGTEKLDEGRLGRVACVTDLYLPERCRRQGAGTSLIEALLELWERARVAAVRATTTEEGHAAFSSWGFSLATPDVPADPLRPMRLRLPRVSANG